MKSVELLAPVGDFDCLKAAVQNGADSVYFGGSLFNARASATNFNNLNLKKAIDYAKIRNVKTHLTLNTLLKDEEFDEAVALARKAYEYGIDAIIVQDLGLALYLHENFPDIPLHASTQMTIHRLEGVKKIQQLGFQRAVLARELSLEEIEHICKNTDLEIEVFVHGALCISYSGQCLFSSSVGARSGNRGRCAQSCRMPYKLYEQDSESESLIDSGYLLSPRDLYGLEHLEDLIRAGVTCFKIEGRMKTPEYVATVTRIYRKHIDAILAGNVKPISEKDKEDLLQVFNRGGFSSGHLSSEPNHDLVFPEKPNNMGLYLGNVSNFQPNKGLVSLHLNQTLAIGDTISFEKEESKYTVSELMVQNKNIPQAKAKEKVTIGRMKGNIEIGNKVFKMANKELTQQAFDSYTNKENRKIPLACEVFVQKDQFVHLSVEALHSEEGFYQGLSLHVTSDFKPINAISVPLTEERIKQQLIKTNNTPFEFASIQIHLDPGLYLPKISILNELRRTALSNLEAQVCAKHQRVAPLLDSPHYEKKTNLIKQEKTKVSALFNLLNTDMDYSQIKGIDHFYIPLKYFVNKKLENILKTLSEKGKLYVYIPTIVKSNYKNLVLNQLENILNTFPIQGFVLSNLSNLECLKDYQKDYEFISNYTFNVFNQSTIHRLKDLGMNRVTVSPELTKEHLNRLTDEANVPVEVMAYGRLPLMNMNYCPLGKSNRCYPTCLARCLQSNLYLLEDRMHLRFPILPDNMQTVTTVYNSKITFLDSKSLHSKNLRMDFLNESIEEINEVVAYIRAGKRKTGDFYTNGNFAREV